MEDHPLLTLDEANALVPTLNVAFERLTRLRRHIAEHVERLEASGLAVDEGLLELEGDDLEPEQRTDLARLRQLLKGIRDTLSRLHEKGCLVKDLERGLVDFYSIVDGRPAYLCWQYGEAEVSWYHPIETGFAGREPLPGGHSTDVLYN